ncbi:LysM peptidoglycan-binding domain-containing M23 family metallopeptidase [Streptomyces sp. NPDC049954]|uniref:M23 family metallopeptidase n=1 Tax=Streptomyces sp. NPDC049954 TaxID=3155779 RepID=UPI00342CDB88
MPAQGKNRRSLSHRLALIGTTGAAAVVLPLTAAAGAHAAAPEAAPQKADTTYTVVKGDTLAKIARTHHVDGGWKKLYEINKKAVGANPSIIKPGLKITLEAAKAAAPAAKPAPADSGWTAPVVGVKGGGYGNSGNLWSHGHTGADFPVSTGTSVKAVSNGTVIAAGDGGAYGNQIVIKHGDGHYSQYGHLSSIGVSVGQTVTEGQQIGLSGATGNVTGPHLHFEIRTGPDYGSDIDPLAFLAQHGVNA